MWLRIYFYQKVALHVQTEARGSAACGLLYSPAAPSPARGIAHGAAMALAALIGHGVWENSKYCISIREANCWLLFS